MRRFGPAHAAVGALVLSKSSINYLRWLQRQSSYRVLNLWLIVWLQALQTALFQDALWLFLCTAGNYSRRGSLFVSRKVRRKQRTYIIKLIRISE